MIFLYDIFSGSRAMLKPWRNNRQSQQLTRRNGRLLVADSETKISLSWSLNRLQLSLYQQAGETGSKYSYLRRNGLTEQEKTSSCRVVMIRHSWQIGWLVPTRTCAKHREVLLWFTWNIGLPRWTNRLQYRLSIEIFIDNLQQSVSSVKRGDQFDQ